MDSINPPHDANICPTIVDPTANAAIFEAGTLGSVPKLLNVLPPRINRHFPTAICEQLVGIATAPKGGTVVDFTDAAYATVDALVKAAM